MTEPRRPAAAQGVLAGRARADRPGQPDARLDAVLAELGSRLWCVVCGEAHPDEPQACLTLVPIEEVEELLGICGGCGASVTGCSPGPCCTRCTHHGGRAA
jgi:hypothetical protein